MGLKSWFKGKLGDLKRRLTASGGGSPYSATAGSRRTDFSILLFLCLAIIYHIFIIFTQPPLGTRLAANILMLFSAFLLFDPSERTKETWQRLFFIAIAELLYPLLISKIPSIQHFDFVRLYIASGILPLFWFYYALSRGSGSDSRIVKGITIAVFIFWFFVAFSYINTYITPLNEIQLTYLGERPTDALKGVFSRGWDGLKSIIGFLWDGVKGILGIFDIEKKQLTGEYYAGVVDENEQQKLGVSLERLQPTKPEFYRDEKVALSAVLTTRTLEDEVNVEVSCYQGAKQGTKKNKNGKQEDLVYGAVYPDTAFTISDLQDEEIDCSFPEGSLDAGSNKVAVAAAYNFETIGYVKRYFTNKDALNAAKRQDIDLLQEYEIKDRQPIAKYTPGPVRLGIGPEEELLGISEDEIVKPRLGITLDGDAGWGGHIKQINELVVVLPEEMSLDMQSCSDPNFAEYEISDCVADHRKYNTRQSQECSADDSCLNTACEQELSGKHAYSLDVNKNPKLYSDLKSFITISCRLNIDDVQGLLGSTPLSTQYFYVKTRYAYETEKTGVVYVKDETLSGDVMSKPRRYSNDDALLDSIYLEHYFEHPEVQDALQKYGSGINDELNDPYLIMGMIAVKSKNNPAYVGKRSRGIQEKGLMHLTDAQITRAKELLGISSFAVFEPAQNIAAGVRMLASYDALPATKNLDDVLAVYYSGEDALVPASGCDKKYLCDPSFEETRQYIALVHAYTDKARSKGLLEQGKLLDVEHAQDYAVTGSISLAALQSPSATLPTTPPSSTISSSSSTTPLSTSIALEDMHIMVDTKKLTAGYATNVTALIDGQSYYVGGFLFSSSNNINQWIQLNNLPFLQFKVNQGLSVMEYKFLKSNIVNSGSLVEESIPYTLWTNISALAYDGNELHFSFERLDKDIPFCEIQWPRDVVVARCDESDVKGITARRIERSEGLASSLGTGSTRAQVQYDAKAQLLGIGTQH